MFASPTTPLTVTINVAPGQDDPATNQPVYYAVVFSEAVTGFTDVGVNLSGTAGATTAVVTNSGDDIHFTVAVSGMTDTGTVIAVVQAGAATAIATGAPNEESTSTDNIIDFYVFPDAGMRLWLDGDDPLSIHESGTDVTEWDDKSGNARDAVVNGTNYPQYTSPGQGFVEFVGTSRLDIASGSIFTATSIDYVGLYLVRLAPSPSGDGTILAGWSSADGRTDTGVTAAGEIRFYWQGSSEVTIVDYTSTATPFDDADWHLLEVHARVANDPVEKSVVFLIDGEKVDGITFNSFASTFSLTQTRVGAGGSTTGALEGDVALVAVWDDFIGHANNQMMDLARIIAAGQQSVAITTYDDTSVAGGAGTTLLGLTGLLGWLDASDSDGADRINGYLMRAAEKVNANTLITRVGSPYASKLNGLPTWSFDSTASEILDGLMASAATNNTAHIFAVCRWPGGSGTTTFVRTYRTTDADPFRDIRCDSTGQLTVRRQNDSGSVLRTLTETGNSMADNAWHLVELRESVSGTTLTLQIIVDGSVVASTTYSTANSVLQQDAIQLRGGEVAEVATANPATVDAATVRARMMSRWGL